MKHIHTFESFLNEMKVNRNMNFSKLDLKTIYDYAEPHPSVDSSFSYYEKIGPYGLSIVGGDFQPDYERMDPALRNLYSSLGPGSSRGRNLLKGDFQKTFEVMIFDFEGEDVTDQFTDQPHYATIQEVNLIRKKMFDAIMKGYVGNPSDLISNAGSRR